MYNVEDVAWSILSALLPSLDEQVKESVDAENIHPAVTEWKPDFDLNYDWNGFKKRMSRVFREFDSKVDEDPKFWDVIEEGVQEAVRSLNTVVESMK